MLPVVKSLISGFFMTRTRRLLCWAVALTSLLAILMIWSSAKRGTCQDIPPSPEDTAALGINAEQDTVISDLPAPTKPHRKPAEPERSSIPTVSIRGLHNIPPGLSTVMGNGPENNYFIRLKAVHSLGKNLSQDEINALYVLLNRKKGEDKLRLAQLNAVKNDIVNVLKSQHPLPTDLANNLMAMYHDKSHDEVWRDYCIQHLGSIYPKLRREERQSAKACLWSAVDETGSSIGGTALIALTHHLIESDAERHVVGKKALALAEDPQCGELAKITALQICARLGEKKALPLAREIATSRKSVPLRMSAIAAVGTLGSESDREMLEKYAASTDVRLRKSAQSALKRLE